MLSADLAHVLLSSKAATVITLRTHFCQMRIWLTYSRISSASCWNESYIPSNGEDTKSPGS